MIVPLSIIYVILYHNFYHFSITHVKKRNLAKLSSKENTPQGLFTTHVLSCHLASFFLPAPQGTPHSQSTRPQTHVRHLGAPERRGHQDGEWNARPLQRRLHARHLHARHDARADRGGKHDGERAGDKCVITLAKNPSCNHQNRKEVKIQPNGSKRAKSPGRERLGVLVCPPADFVVWVRYWVWRTGAIFGTPIRARKVIKVAVFLRKPLLSGCGGRT